MGVRKSKVHKIMKHVQSPAICDLAPELLFTAEREKLPVTGYAETKLPIKFVAPRATISLSAMTSSPGCCAAIDFAIAIDSKKTND